MKVDKSLTSGSTTMLILRLLDNEDMYGYQMIDLLRQRSNEVFSLKAGTLYPILHSLEQQGMIAAYEGVSEEGRSRKYYKITEDGKKLFQEKQAEWNHYADAVKAVLGGACYAGC